MVSVKENCFTIVPHVFALFRGTAINSIHSLRRHYPDQVQGCNLSLSHEKHPDCTSILFPRAKLVKAYYAVYVQLDAGAKRALCLCRDACTEKATRAQT